MSNQKGKGIVIGVMIGVIAFGLAGSLSVMTKGFQDWDFDDISIPWISTTSEPTDTSSEEPPDEEPELFPENHVFRALNVGRTLTVTLNPANTSYRTISWTTSDSSKVTIAPNADTLSAVATAVASFENNVTITATHVRSGQSVSCVCSYYSGPDRVYIVVSDDQSGDPLFTLDNESETIDLAVGEYYRVDVYGEPTATYGDAIYDGAINGEKFELNRINSKAFTLHVTGEVLEPSECYVDFLFEDYPEVSCPLSFRSEVLLTSMSISDPSILF